MQKMKPLIIIDYSHTSMRMVFVAIAQTKPGKKDGKYITKDFIQYYKHLMFNSLQFVKNKFKGEVVLAIDSKHNWRKDFYTDYKANRVKSKSDTNINYEEFFEEVDNLTDTIRGAFPFKVVKVDKAEADDIAGTVALTYGNQRPIILVTSDHDWSQVLSHGQTQMWEPIKKKFVQLTDFENTIIDTDYGPMSKFTIIHSLIGDKGDNVPSITGMTEFTDTFKAHLKANEIYSEKVQEFNAMSIKEEIIDKFDSYRIVKSGKLKGQATDEKDIFRTVPFGIKKAQKVCESSEHLKDFLNSHEMYKDSFERNRTLVDFDEIPQDIKDEILREFHRVQVNYNPNEMLSYFMNENLGQMVSSINKFYDISYEAQVTTSLDDFF